MVIGVMIQNTDIINMLNLFVEKWQFDGRILDI